MFFVGRRQSSSNEFIDSADQQLIPFVSATQNLVLLSKKWQEQLKTERERVRRTLITGNYDTADDTLDLHAVQDAIVTVMDPTGNNNNNLENYGSILPVVSVTTNFPTQKSIADESLRKERDRCPSKRFPPMAAYRARRQRLWRKA